MSSQPPISPDSRKKKPALPFLLSNLRNAHSAIATSVAGTIEARPLVSGGTSSNDHSSNYAASDRSNMKRSVTASLSSNRAPPALDTAPNTRLNTNPAPTSLSSTLTSIQQRFENSWRKRNQHLHKEDDSLRHNTKQRRQIRVSIPQSFLLTSVCFFLAIPVLVLLYVLARKSVFGDEGVEISEHKYEVKTFDGELPVGEQQTVLGELESQLKDVLDVDHAATVDTLGLLGDESAEVEHEQQNIQGEISNLEGSADASQEETNNSELQQSDVSRSKDGNLRGYQGIPINVGSDIEDESNPRIDESGNMQLDSEKSSDALGDKTDAELTRLESVDSNGGS